MAPGIYVETFIKQPIERLWSHTQQPELHTPWDLRFSTITYLPRDNEASPQRFLYATKIGFGLNITGTGDSTTHDDLLTGVRTSSLRFGSKDSRSLILEGSGYWRYVPTDKGIRFFTWYDYKTRFGLIGRFFDRVAFRPLLGWATAWSFDRLRLWLEHGLEPTVALRHALIYFVSRLSLSLIFFYHGLVPKILFYDADERFLLQSSGLTASYIDLALVLLGYLEVAFASVLLLRWRDQWLLILPIVGMVIATIAISFTAPHYLSRAFNPVSLNFAVISLAIIAVLAYRYTPFAGHCLRAPPDKDS